MGILFAGRQHSIHPTLLNDNLDLISFPSVELFLYECYSTEKIIDFSVTEFTYKKIVFMISSFARNAGHRTRTWNNLFRRKLYFSTGITNNRDSFIQRE